MVLSFLVPSLLRLIPRRLDRFLRELQICMFGIFSRVRSLPRCSLAVVILHFLFCHALPLHVRFANVCVPHVRVFVTFLLLFRCLLPPVRPPIVWLVHFSYLASTKLVFVVIMCWLVLIVVSSSHIVPYCGSDRGSCSRLL